MAKYGATMSRKKQIDAAVDKAVGGKAKPKQKTKSAKRTGGMGAGSIEAVMNRLAKERKKNE